MSAISSFVSSAENFIVRINAATPEAREQLLVQVLSSGKEL